jgi:hypothetical protein
MATDRELIMALRDQVLVWDAQTKIPNVTVVLQNHVVRPVLAALDAHCKTPDPSQQLLEAQRQIARYRHKKLP